MRLFFSFALIGLFTSFSSQSQVIPDPPVISGNTDLCEGENTVLTTTPDSGASIQWWDAAIGGNLLSEEPSYTIESLEVGNYDFYVNQILEGITSQRTHVSVSVVEIPIISYNFSGETLCQGQSVSFDLVGASFYEVDYNGSISTIYQEEGNMATFDMIAANETQTVGITGFLNQCQSTVLSFEVDVFSMESIADFNLCYGLTETLTITTSTNNVSYEWTPSNVIMQGNQASFSPLETTSYQLIVTETNLGCTVEEGFEINVLPTSDISIIDDFTVTAGDKVELQATSAISPISWSTNHGNYGNLQGSNVFVVPTTQTTYTATINNVHGCQSSESVTVSVNHLPDISGTFKLVLNGNETVQTEINADGTGPFQWYDVEIGGTPLQDSFNTFITPPLTESKDFWVSDNGGPRKRVSIFVDVSSQITIESTNVDASFCESMGVILSPTFSGSVDDCSVEWYQVGQESPILTTQGTNSAVVYPEYGTQPSYYAVATCSSITESFESPGRYEWTVPDGITSIDVFAVGSRGTRPTNTQWAFQNGAPGGKVEASLNVTPGQTLFLRVGGVGYNGGHGQSCGSWQGSGINGGSGGATDIRINGEELTDRILVAGGGGGGMYYNGSYQAGVGGSGGGLISGNGSSYTSPYCNNYGGTGGTQVAGGNGGVSGSFGVGATCSSYGMSCYGANVYTVWKNPGGGGWFGGGGGDGGGGGSSYTSDLYVSNVGHQVGYGDKLLSITYGSDETILVSNEFTLSGDGIYDECNVCNGPGAVFVCGCEDIPEGDCACGGLINDACGECGGTGVDSDGDGVCDSQEVYGCQDESACNYNEESTEHEMSICQYLDGCGVCGGDNSCCESQYSVTSLSASSCLSGVGEITAQVAGCEPILVSQPVITYLLQFLAFGEVPACFTPGGDPESCYMASNMISWYWDSSYSWADWLGEYNYDEIMSALQYIIEQGSTTPQITAFYNWMDDDNPIDAENCFNEGNCEDLFWSVECCPGWNESIWNPDSYIPDIFVLLNNLYDLQSFYAPGCAATIVPVVDNSQCREVAVQLIMPSNHGPISFSLLDETGEIVEDLNGNLIQDSFCDDGYLQPNGYIACSGASSYIQGNNPIFHACLTEGECYMVTMYAEQNGLCDDGGCTNPDSYDAWSDNGPHVRIMDIEAEIEQNFTFYEGLFGTEEYCVFPYEIQPNSGNTSEGEFIFSGIEPGNYNVNFVTNYGIDDVACSGQLTVEIECCENDIDADGICDEEDDCVGSYDVCGVCNGEGAIYTCGCESIPIGDCNCDGSQLDAIGLCGGLCTADDDIDGVCDDVDDCVGSLDDCDVCNGDNTCVGCTYENATNYEPTATLDDGSCIFADGNDICTGDLDGNGNVSTSDLLIFLAAFDSTC